MTRARKYRINKTTNPMYRKMGTLAMVNSRLYLVKVLSKPVKTRERGKFLLTDISRAVIESMVPSTVEAVTTLVSKYRYQPKFPTTAGYLPPNPWKKESSVR